ncbi:MAG: winged helix-turn-helix domain-containing protein [Solirubrobacteraceae bacterium]
MEATGQQVERGAAAGVVSAGGIEIRPREYVAALEGQALALTMRELQLLTALVSRAGRIVSRGELYSVVWGEPYRKADRSVDVYVGKLRQKLEQHVAQEHFIHTHFGFGYRCSREPKVGAMGARAPWPPVARR